MEYELTPDAIELGLDAALLAVLEIGQVREFGRGERACANTIQRSVRIAGDGVQADVDASSEIALASLRHVGRPHHRAPVSSDRWPLAAGSQGQG